MSSRTCGNCNAPFVGNDRGRLVIWASFPWEMTSCHLCSACSTSFDKDGMGGISRAWR
jgi:hypothetical protein